MLGAGDFAAFSPAAAAAGSGMLIGLAIAAAVAYCNAVASAQLAAQYATSGGAYVYGRERLGEWWGFVAGWSFVIGKTASCAAIALTFAAYTAPPTWQRPVAVAAVVAVAVLNRFGVDRTALAFRLLAVVTKDVGEALQYAAFLGCGRASPRIRLSCVAEAAAGGLVRPVGPHRIGAPRTEQKRLPAR